MPNDNTKIRPFVSASIDRFIPEHIRENHPKFVQFIQSYLEFLETSHRSGYFQNSLPEQRNLELQENIFLSEIEKEIGLFVPREYAASPRVFYNKITDLWRSKGSEEGIKLFFRLFLGEIVQIRLPWDNVLKPSDGRWINDKRLRISVIRGNAENFVNKRIVQLESFALAFVKDVEKKEYEDGTIFELSLDINLIVGEFIPGNRIILEDQSSDVEAEIYNSVKDVQIIEKGYGYSIGSKIQIENLSNVTFEGRITKVNESGGIEKITIIDSGAGSTPNHILNTKTEGFVFRNFVIFNYFTDEFRTQILGDSTDFTENVVLYGQNYTSEFYFDEFFNTKIEIVFPYTEENNNPYFLENYFQTELSISETGTEFSSVTQNSGINTIVNPTQPVAIRPSDILGSGNIVILDKNGKDAILKLVFGSIVQKTQYYSGVKGQLSESIVVQDSNFYQKFSYEVISTLNIDQWLDPLKKTVHPAGIKPFSLIRLDNELFPRPEFILNNVSSLLLDPTSPVLPFSSVFYKFTKRLGNISSYTDSQLEEEIFSYTEENNSPYFLENYIRSSTDVSKIGSYFSEDYNSSKNGFKAIDLGIKTKFKKGINDDSLNLEFDEKIKKEFTKGIIDFSKFEDLDVRKNFIKKIEASAYTFDPNEEPYFLERYEELPTEIIVKDFDIKKEFIKELSFSNVDIISETKKEFTKGLIDNIVFDLNNQQIIFNSNKILETPVSINSSQIDKNLIKVLSDTLGINDSSEIGKNSSRQNSIIGFDLEDNKKIKVEKNLDDFVILNSEIGKNFTKRISDFVKTDTFFLIGLNATRQESPLGITLDKKFEITKSLNTPLELISEVGKKYTKRLTDFIGLDFDENIGVFVTVPRDFEDSLNFDLDEKVGFNLIKNLDNSFTLKSESLIKTFAKKINTNIEFSFGENLNTIFGKVINTNINLDFDQKVNKEFEKVLSNNINLDFDQKVNKEFEKVLSNNINLDFDQKVNKEFEKNVNGSFSLSDGGSISKTNDFSNNYFEEIYSKDIVVSF